MASLLRDRRVQIALGISLLEWLIVGGTAVFGSASQFPVVLTVITVASLTQFAALFWRFQRNPLARAQQLFRAGQFEAALHELETLVQHDPTNTQALTLLGNTYRQAGRIAESEQVLQEAVQQTPDDAFPLYGLGRTLMVQGKFAESAEWIEKSLAHGGRKVIRADLALVYYLQDKPEKAGEAAAKAARLLQMENFRVLMVNYILHQTRQDEKALGIIQRHADALRYWQAEVTRFAETPYGSILQSEVAQLQNLLGKDT